MQALLQNALNLSRVASAAAIEVTGLRRQASAERQGHARNRPMTDKKFSMTNSQSKSELLTYIVTKKSWPEK